MGIFDKLKKSKDNKGIEKIDASQYGGFMISKNITHNGKRIKYSYREQSSIPNLNGWTIYSEIDDDSYVSDPNNFEIVGATTISKISPIMLEIFNAPYGTDLSWVYNENGDIGFYDLKRDKDTTVKEILKK